MRRRITAAFCALALFGVARAEDGEAPKRRKASVVATIETTFAVAGQRVLDVDKDGRAELLVVGTNGEVRAWRRDAESGRISEKPFGSLVLRFPDRTLLAVADVYGDGRPPQLVEMTKDGVFAHQAEKDGSYARGGDPVAPKCRMPLRAGVPTFAEIARDVNGDGRIDLVVPRGDDCELWLNGGIDKATSMPTFTRAAVIRVDTKRETALRADALSDVLESSFRIPRLSFDDVNGDKKPDLVVADGHVHAWRFQRDDGFFPKDADVTLDLSTFRDTTPDAAPALGRTVAGGDDQRMTTRDLDGDGVPDYVIAHRRKVWVFHGTREGPQFKTPSDVLRVADDVTQILVLRIDDDKYPDLLLLRFQMPTIATLLRGLVAEWDLELSAVGYRNVDGARFDPSAKWKGGMSIRLPAILGLIRHPEEVVRKLEGTANKFRRVVSGDFDGDGRGDVAVADEKGERIDFFVDAAKAGEDGERAIADLLFGTEKSTWELSEVLAWVGDFATRQTARRTGGGAAFASLPLRDESEFVRTGAYAAAFDGAGRADLVVAYERNGAGVFDVVRVE